MQILLADDHTLIRENLVTFLVKLDPHALVHEAGTLPEAEKVMAQHAPLDLAILDLNMPGMDGLDRKSTRLNSSHITTSYAVFCLKKKKKHTAYRTDHTDDIVGQAPAHMPR